MKQIRRLHLQRSVSCRLLPCFSFWKTCLNSCEAPSCVVKMRSLYGARGGRKWGRGEGEGGGVPCISNLTEFEVTDQPTIFTVNRQLKVKILAIRAANCKKIVNNHANIRLMLRYATYVSLSHWRTLVYLRRIQRTMTSTHYNFQYIIDHEFKILLHEFKNGGDKLGPDKSLFRI